MTAGGEVRDPRARGASLRRSASVDLGLESRRSRRVADHRVRRPSTARCRRRTRRGWPGESVFGYGLTCSGPCSSRRVGAGRQVRLLDGTDSPPGTSSIATMDEPQPRPRGDVLGQQARDVAQEQRHVVARRLDRRQERQRRAQAGRGQREPVEALLDRRVLAVALQRAAARLDQLLVQRGGPRQVLAPAANASASTGALWGSVANPGRAPRTAPPCRSGTAGCVGLSGDHGLERRRRLGDPVLEERDGDARPARGTWCRGSRTGRPVSGRPGASAPANASRPRKKPPRSVRGEARLRATGPRSVTSGTNAPIASLMSTPRPASAVAEADGRRGDAGARGPVEHRQDLVEVDLGAGLADRHGGAVGAGSARIGRA